MNPATAYHQLKNILAKTKLECAAKLAQLWDALKEPTLDQPKPEILLADWLDLCYQEYKKPNLLPNTQMSYERRIYQHILNSFSADSHNHCSGLDLTLSTRRSIWD